MSQKDNIAGLQSILETVNSLPEAGSGGGGGTPETCTVRIEMYDVNISAITPNGVHIFYATPSSNLVYVSFSQSSNFPNTISNVACDHLFCVKFAGTPSQYIDASYDDTNVTENSEYLQQGYGIAVLYIPANVTNVKLTIYGE